MLVCTCVCPAKTWQVSLAEISQSQQEEMRWNGWGNTKVTLDFWCPINVFIWYWLSKLWLWPSAGHKHLRVVQLLRGIGHRNAGYQHFSPWVVCVIKVDEDPVSIQVPLHSGSTSPIVLASRPPASHLVLGAARAEFKALHGEGFRDTSL